jgi:hypothetical protein
MTLLLLVLPHYLSVALRTDPWNQNEKMNQNKNSLDKDSRRERIVTQDEE